MPSGSGRWPQPQGRLPPRRPPRSQRPSWLVEPPAVPGQGLLALDGGYVQSHDNPEGMEGKVAAESGVAQAESLVVLGWRQLDH